MSEQNKNNQQAIFSQNPKRKIKGEFKDIESQDVKASAPCSGNCQSGTCIPQ